MQLFINTYGTYVHVKDQMFEIKVPETGNTGNFIKHHFAAQKVTHIMMSNGASLSIDATILALKYNVDIIIVDYNGQPLGRVWHCKLGSTTRIRKAQLEASRSPIAVKYTKDWIGEKIENQVNFIQDLKKHRTQLHDYLDEKVNKINEMLFSLGNMQSDKIEDIADTVRGLEGTSGRLYFETLSYVMPDEYKFSGRSGRPAKDSFNAFLNYAYGILYSRIEKALIIAGIDPYLGFLHRDDYNQLSMVFDFIEPYRIYADTIVFRLFSGKKVNKSHTDQLANGMRLNKEGKELLVASYNSYMENESIRFSGRNQTRNNIIQIQAHHFATSLIKAFNNDKSEIIEFELNTIAL